MPDTGSSEHSDRAVDSGLVRAPGNVGDASFTIRKPRSGKEQIAETIHEFDGVNVDRISVRKTNDGPFRPPTGATGHVNAGGQFGPAGHDEGLDRFIATFYRVDRTLEIGHVLLGHATDLVFMFGPTRRGEIRTQIEKT